VGRPLGEDPLARQKGKQQIKQRLILRKEVVRTGAERIWFRVVVVHGSWRYIYIIV
jgi:hypothetical protein